MATSNPSQALTKRPSDMALMPPPPPPKRQNRPAKVLDEDVYSDAISHIIARDFFPGLLETEVQEEYIQALDSKDNQWIREAGRKLTQVMTPLPEGRRRMGTGTGFTPRRSTALGDTPWDFTGETPAQTPGSVVAGTGGDFTPEETPDVDVNMSLGAFQAKYTSEDNESFNALLDTQNEKRAAKYAFFHHGNKIPTARQITYRKREPLESRQGLSTALITTNAAGEQRQAVAPLRPSQDLDARPASLDMFPRRQGPNNTLMFGPESVEDRAMTYAQEREQASNAPPKGVKYTSTRFSVASSQPQEMVPPSPSMSAIDTAIADRPRPTSSERGYPGAETPRVNGYAFVDAEPTPFELGLPVSEEEADAAEREAAARFLPKAEEGAPNPFKINERSKREDLHMRLVEKADVERRKGGRLDRLRSLGVTPSPSRNPTPKFASAPRAKRGATMTPAAQHLAARIGTPKRGADGFGVMSGAKKATSEWTPTPKVRREIW